MKLFVPIAAMTLLALTVSPASLQAQHEIQSADEQSAQLFHNMYTTGPGTHTAGMYPAPHPTPRNAGHVFYTYQPFAPHQMMYEHNRTYYTPYGGPGTFYQDPCHTGRRGAGSGEGLNVTTVVWQHGGTFATPYPFQLRSGNRFSGQRHIGGRFAASNFGSGFASGATLGSGTGYGSGCNTCK